MQQELIKETLESMKEYMPKLVAASEKLAHDIQLQEGAWVETLVAYLEGIAWVAAAIQGIQQLNQEVLKNLDLDVLASIIDQLRLALEQQDFVSMCDLLQYEIQPLLQSYDNELRGIVH